LEEVMEVLSSTRLHVEPHPYTLREVSVMLQRGNALMVNALREGIVLYETEKLRTLRSELVKEGP